MFRCVFRIYVVYHLPGNLQERIAAGDRSRSLNFYRVHAGHVVHDKAKRTSIVSRNRFAPLLFRESLRKLRQTSGAPLDPISQYGSATTAQISLSRNDFKIFSVDLAGTIRSFVVRGPKVYEFFTQLILTAHIQRRKRARHWTIVSTVKINYRLRAKWIVEVIITSSKLQISNAVAQTFPNGDFVTPQHR